MGVKRKYQGPPCILQTSEDEQNTEESVREIQLRWIRSLGLFCILKDPCYPNGTKMKPPKQIPIHNRESVESWLLLNLPHTNPADVPVLNEMFVLGMPTVASSADQFGWNVLSEIGRFPQNKETKKNQKQENANSLKTKEKNYKCSLESICASKEILNELGYPKTGVRLDKIEGKGEGYAIDCEMCLSGTTQVLTRLAVVRFSDGEVIIDQLVKPDAEISDYVTPFSGITKEMLEDVTFTIEDAQEWMRDNVGSTDILIGHSVDNDLNVMKIQHDRIVDTSLLFPHYRGLPYRSSLKYLTKKYLDWEIQKETVSGHNPVEDANACERLVQLILQHGPEFGDERLQSLALTTHLSQYALKSTIIGPGIPDWDGNGMADHISETDIGACVQAALKARENNHFVCVTLHSDNKEVINEQIRYLMSKIPSRTLITALSGAGDHHAKEIQRLREKKRTYQREYKTKKWDEIKDPWTSEDDTAMKTTFAKLRRGYAHFTVTVDQSELVDLPTKVRDMMLTVEQVQKANTSKDTNLEEEENQEKQEKEEGVKERDDKHSKEPEDEAQKSA